MSSKNTLLIPLLLLMAAGPAFAQEAGMLSILVNSGRHVAYGIDLVRYIMMATGVYFVLTGLVELWAVSDDRALKYLRGRDRLNHGSAIVSLLLGGILLAMAQVTSTGGLAVLSRTIGVTTSGAGSNWSWAWDGPMTAEAAEQMHSKADLGQLTHYAKLGLLGIMKVLGLAAILRGWLTLNAYYNQRYNAGLGTAIAWLIGGVLAWNLQWFADILNNSLGVNLFWAFGYDQAAQQGVPPITPSGP